MGLIAHAGCIMMQWAPLLKVGSLIAILHHGLLLVNIVVGAEHLDFETTQGNDNGNRIVKAMEMPLEQ